MKHHEVLKKIIDANRFQNIVELGIYTAQTTKFLLKNCPSIKKYFAIDTWSVVPSDNGINYGKMAFYSQDFWDTIYSKVLKLQIYFKDLQIIRASSLEACFLFKSSSIDLVYIDTTHSYQDTMAEIKAWQFIVRDGGILAGHDYGKSRDKGYQVDTAVNEYFGKTFINLYDDGVWTKKILRPS